MKKREPKVIETGLIDWLRDKKELVELFGEQEVIDALSQTGYTSDSHPISSTEYYEFEPQWVTPRERTNGQPRVEEKKKKVNGREEWVKITKHEWRIPSSYQSGVVSEIMRMILAKKISWFKEFEWAVYGNLSGNSEIYLHTGYDHDKWEGQELSLYVPLKALLDRDWKAIEKRNMEYWKEYTHPSDRKWNNREEDPTCQEVYDGYIEVFKTPVVQKFKQLLQEPKTNGNLSS